MTRCVVHVWKQTSGQSLIPFLPKSCLKNGFKQLYRLNLIYSNFKAQKISFALPILSCACLHHRLREINYPPSCSHHLVGLHRHQGYCSSSHPLAEFSPYLPSPCLVCYRYSIDRRTDMDRLFNVHPGNGSLFLLKRLDREETAWHNISVIATEFSKCGVVDMLWFVDVEYKWTKPDTFITKGTQWQGV